MESFKGKFEINGAVVGFLLMFLAGPIVLVGMGVFQLMNADDSASTTRTATVVDRFSHEIENSVSHGLIVEFEPGPAEAGQRIKLNVSESMWINTDPGTSLVLYGEAGDTSSFTLSNEEARREDAIGLIRGGIGLGVFMTVALLVFG